MLFRSRPAMVEGVYINEDERMATAVVPDQQLSLAIGREGQNVRLAARVSGWKIDIKSKEQLEENGFDFDDYEDVDEEKEDIPEADTIEEDVEVSDEVEDAEVSDEAETEETEESVEE